MQLLGSCLGNPRRCGHQDGAAKRQRDVLQHHGHLKERRPGGKVPVAQPVPWGECPPSPASAPSINPFVSPQKSSNYGRKSSLPLEVPPPQTVTLLTLAGGGTFRNARKIWGGGGRRHPGSNLLPPAASPPLSPAHPHPYHQDFGDIFLQPPSRHLSRPSAAEGAGGHGPAPLPSRAGQISLQLATCKPLKIY